MRALYDHPLAGSVKGRDTAGPLPHTMSGLKYGTIPNAHLVGTWLHQEREGSASPVCPPAGRVGERAWHCCPAPPLNIRTEVYSMLTL
jgi:hypothetical protein